MISHELTDVFSQNGPRHFVFRYSLHSTTIRNSAVGTRRTFQIAAYPDNPIDSVCRSTVSGIPSPNKRPEAQASPRS
jgi:hypothetical protein